MMTLTEMRYIVALAQEKHFGRAANACYVSQPTLSVAIKKVEGLLRSALFERGVNEVRITPLGEKIVEQAKKVLQEAVKLDEIASAIGDPLNGALRVGVIYTVAPYLLPKLVPAVHKQAPNMPLFLKEDFTYNLITSLKSGDIDVAVIALPCKEVGLVSQSIYEEQFKIIVPAGHQWASKENIKKNLKIPADQLNPQEILLLGHGNCFRDQVIESCSHFKQLHKEKDSAIPTYIEGSSLETILYMVESGSGIAVMPNTALSERILSNSDNLVKVLEFEDPVPYRTIGLVWRVTFPRTKAVMALKSAILNCGITGVTWCKNK